MTFLTTVTGGYTDFVQDKHLYCDGMLAQSLVAEHIIVY